MTSRRWWWGAAAVAAYAATAAALGATGRPVMPVFDGQAPPAPYRWVDPPEEFASTNETPASGRQELVFGDDQRPPLVNAFTEDGQAVLTGPETTFAPEEGEEGFEVILTPQDLNRLGPPPQGLAFDGNAYRVEARYVPSMDPAPLAEPATLVLRYPVHATQVLRWDGTGWERLPGARPLPAALQVFVEVRELGMFVAAGPPRQEPSGLPRLLGYAAAALALLLVILYPTIRARVERARAQRRRGGRPAPRPPAKKKKGKR